MVYLFHSILILKKTYKSALKDVNIYNHKNRHVKSPFHLLIPLITAHSPNKLSMIANESQCLSHFT